MNPALENIYLDWINNYLTFAKFAEDYGVSEEFARELLYMIGCEREAIIEENKRDSL